MKEYSTLSRALELEPHYPTQFNAMPSFFGGWLDLTTLLEIKSAYFMLSQHDTFRILGLVSLLIEYQLSQFIQY